MAKTWQTGAESVPPKSRPNEYSVFYFYPKVLKNVKTPSLKKKKKDLSSEKPPLYIIRKYPTSKINKRVLDKLNIESPYDPVMPFLDKHTPQKSQLVLKKIGVAQMSIAVLFT